MQVHMHLWRSLFGKAALATAALGGLLILGVPSAKADGFDDCNRRAAYADWRLHESIEHFGYYSAQASYWRHEQHEAYERLERYRADRRREEYREHERREHRGWDRD